MRILLCLSLGLLSACQTTGIGPAPVWPAKPVSSASVLPTYLTDTLSGTGLYGFQEGAGDQAQFYNPSSILLANDGDLLVLDRFNYRIRRVKLSGETSTWWGNGQRGNRDGDASTGRMNDAIAMIQDPDGSVVVADAQNHTLRRIHPNGDILTLAGEGAEGFQDGPARQAAFNWPSDVARDQTGNYYITDRHNHRIRKLSPDGQVSTLAGNKEAGYADDTGKLAQFNEPMGIVLGRDNYLYVSDSKNHLIRQVSLSGEVKTFAGTGLPGSRDGRRDRAEFREPAGLAFDAQDNLYVVDRMNHRVRRINAKGGEVISISGTGERGFENGPGEESSFQFLFDIAVGSDYLYIADYSNHAIRRIQLPKESS